FYLLQFKLGFWASQLSTHPKILLLSNQLGELSATPNHKMYILFICIYCVMEVSSISSSTSLYTNVMQNNVVVSSCFIIALTCWQCISIVDGVVQNLFTVAIKVITNTVNYSTTCL